VPPAIVFAAAPLNPTQRLKARLAQLREPVVVAADNGATTALAFGLSPKVVIGDLDSIEASTLAALESAGVTIETYPRDKDATDGELAVDRALAFDPSELYLLGFLGGPRLDQAVANVLLLTHLEVRTVLLDEANECILVRPGVEYTWRPEAGELVSLIALSEQATGVRTLGLRWTLRGDTLRLGETRGVSNEPIADEVGVSTQTGLLVVTRHFPR